MRKCVCGGEGPVGGECADCRKKRRGTLHRKGVPGAGIRYAPPVVHEVLRGPGAPLDRDLQGFMESRLRYDLSGVRVHTTPEAERSAVAVGAEAYAVGSDVVFAPGQFHPRDAAGLRLLAHELAHVVQTGGRGPSPVAMAVGEPNSSAEVEADRCATAVVDPAADSPMLRVSATDSTLRRTCKQHKDENFYRTAPNYCRDSWFSGLLHPGKRCYREIPVRTRPNECPPGDQVCFDKQGKCEDSWDRVSPVQGKDADGVCDLNQFCAWTGHLAMDVVPGFLGAEAVADELVCEERCMGVPAGGMPWCLDSCRASQRER